MQLLGAADYRELGYQFTLLVSRAQFSELNFAAKSAKPKQCQKGYACKLGCISKDLECDVPLEGQAKTYAGWLKLQVEAGSKLSKEQKEDAEGLGLNPSKAVRLKLKPEPEVTPNPSKISSFQPEALITKLDAKQEEALVEWGNYYQKLKSDPGVPPDQLTRALEAREVAKDAHYYAKQPDYAEGYRAMVDKNGVTQIMAAISIKEGNKRQSPSLYVDALATAPWNVVGDDPKRVKGAGTAMMKALAEESIKRGMEGKIMLYPLDDAVPFYRKLGFSAPNASGDMTLTPKAAHKLLYG